MIPTDLAGDLDLSVSEHHMDFFTRNVVAVLVEQRLLPGVHYGAYTLVPRALLADPQAIVAAEQLALEYLRPWARRPRNPFPPIDLFPNFTRTFRFAQRVTRRVVGFALPRRKDAC